MKTAIASMKSTLSAITSTPSPSFIFATYALKADCETLLGMAEAWKTTVNPRSRQDIWQDGTAEAVAEILSLDKALDDAYTANADYTEQFGQEAIPVATIKDLLSQCATILQAFPVSLARAERQEVKRNEEPCELPCRHILPNNKRLSWQVDQLIDFLRDNIDLLTFPKVAQKCSTLDKATGNQEIAKALVALTVEVHLACTTSGIDFEATI